MLDRGGGPPSRADFWICAAILAVAFAARFAFVVQARECPMFGGVVVDGATYWDWSDRIAAGDFVGRETFYQAPLYPYVLAAIKALFGRDLEHVRLAQCALGALATAFVYLTGARLLGRAHGVAAGLALALYPPAIFYDATIQKTALGGLLTAALLLTSARAREALAWKSWAAAGAVLGLLVLTREETVLLVPVLAAWCFHRTRAATLGVRARLALTFVAGVTAVLLPVAARNAYVGGEFVLTTAQAGPNFYIGNHAGADGTYAPLRPGRGDTQYERVDAVELAEAEAGRSLTPSEVSRHWFAKALEFVTGDPLAYARLLGRKLVLLVNAYEIPDAEDLYFHERYSFVLRALGRVWHFGVLFPLAAAGIASTWSRRRALGPVFLVVGTAAIGVVMFYVFGRYRYTLVPGLAVLAGAGIVGVADLLRSRRWLALGVVGVVALAAAVASNLPRPFARDHGLGVSFQNAGLVQVQRGDLPRAIESFEKAAELRPMAPEAWGNLGFARLQARRFDEAARAFTRELELGPSDRARALTRLGSAVAQGGQPEAALAHFDAALALDPRRVETLDLRATTYVRLGRFRSAIADVRAITQRSPRDREARAKLAMMLAAAPDDAARNGREALAIAEGLLGETGGRDPRVVDLCAVAMAEVGRFDDAVALLRPLVNGGNVSPAMRDHLALFEKRLPLRLRP